MKSLLAAAIAVAVVVSSNSASAQNRSSGHATFRVGVASEVGIDSARRDAGGMPRLIQITTWYPAELTLGRRMTYGEYLDLIQNEKGPASDSALTAGRADFSAFLNKTGMSLADIGTWISMPMLAVRNAGQYRRRFPLIVIAQGNGQSAVNQAPLAEYLASNGYVVATSPSYTRISHPPQSDEDIGPGSEEQADDIAFMVGRLRRRSDVSSRGIGLVAHSLGARGALLYGMRDASVQALVSLDGGIGTATARQAMERAPSFTRRTLSAHVLHFYETLDAFMTPDFALLRETGPMSLDVARVSGMHHHHFTDLGALGDEVPGLMKATHGDITTAPSYRAMMEVTRAFLDTYVRGDKQAFRAARASASRLARNRPEFVFETLHRAGE